MNKWCTLFAFGLFLSIISITWQFNNTDNTVSSFFVLQSKAAYVLFYQRKEIEHQESLVEKETEHDGDIDMLNDGL